MLKRLRTELARYRAARLTAEALVCHHGAMGVLKALEALRAPHDRKSDRVHAERVARFAVRAYARLENADLKQRARLLHAWATRKGSLIKCGWTDGSPPGPKQRGSLIVN